MIKAKKMDVSAHFQKALLNEYGPLNKWTISIAIVRLSDEAIINCFVFTTISKEMIDLIKK